MLPEDEDYHSGLDMGIDLDALPPPDEDAADDWEEDETGDRPLLSPDSEYVRGLKEGFRVATRSITESFAECLRQHQANLRSDAERVARVEKMTESLRHFDDDVADRVGEDLAPDEDPGVPLELEERE